jgi:ribonuclease Y|tara:strand:- start:66679 stop:68046 length:1368 start_codon:yes stop_codon:yes gene_type:complete
MVYQKTTRSLTLSADRREQDLRQELEVKKIEIESGLRTTATGRAALENRRTHLEEQIATSEKREDDARDEAQKYRDRLRKIANMDINEARQALRREVEEDCADEVRDLKEDYLKRSIEEVDAEARNILVAALQRLSAQPHHDITATIIKLPSEDMKGRIIGREGRNIKAFESTTGTTILIDETPETVLISSFDAVRREIARITLESLIADGRIHPVTIEEAAAKATEEVQRSVIAYGENAIQRLRLKRIHPEVISALGRMHFRLANNQNSLAHSIEVANICALIAAELGLDTEIAKRCGLFHDIGKVLTEEYDSSHALAGASFLKQHGEEDATVLNAVAAHHCEVPAESPYVGLLITADRLSSMRPGARAESMDGYIQRVRSLESIALSCEGVKEAYALQAGREIRIIADPGAIDDLDARRLAKKIRRRVEDELQYPGTIRITVIRESRISETAK